MANILFLVEGADVEIKCYNVIKRVLKKELSDKIKFYSYKTNIHNLYLELKNDESLDIITLLQERAKRQNDKENLEMLMNYKFSEIYLIFDLDPQDVKYNKDKIMEMLNLFDNETEHGKLYINYPMIESFKHFKTLPDANYTRYKIKISNCSQYKDLVGKISCINDWRKVGYDYYSIITKQNIEKMSYLISKNKRCTYNNYQERINQKNLFNIQKEKIENDSEVYIVNTFCLWPVDYFPQSFFNRVMNR